jgi:hypothetical protein
MYAFNWSTMPNIYPIKNSYIFTVHNHRAVRAIILLYDGCAIALDRKLEIAKKKMNSFKIIAGGRCVKRLSSVS